MNKLTDSNKMVIIMLFAAVVFIVSVVISDRSNNTTRNTEQCFSQYEKQSHIIYCLDEKTGKFKPLEESNK